MQDSVLIGLKNIIVMVSISIIYCYVPFLAVCLAENLKRRLKERKL